MEAIEKSTRRLSISQLAYITGKGFNSTKRILEESQLKPVEKNDLGTFFDSTQALPLICSSSRSRPELKEQKEQEELEYLRAKREKTEIETQIMSKELIAADEVLKTWNKLMIALKNKLLTLPGRCALQFQLAESAEEAECILKEAVYDSLNELAHLNTSEIIGIGSPRNNQEITAGKSAQEPSATAEAHGQ